MKEEILGHLYREIEGKSKLRAALRNMQIVLNSCEETTNKCFFLLIIHRRVGLLINDMNPPCSSCDFYQLDKDNDT